MNQIQSKETIMKAPRLIAITIVLLFGTATQVHAQTPEERGLQIFEQVSAQNDGFEDSTASMTMTLINRSGKKSVRRMRAKTLEVTGDGDKSMTIFDEPADVKGTATLTYSHTAEADEQWLYLPALKRVKRISSKNKTGAFMGSEFAFEDIGSQEVEKYTYKYLSEEQLDGIAVHKIEGYPTYKYSGYTRLISYIDKERLISLKTEFYDRKDVLLKTLTMSDYIHHDDKNWRPGRMEMVNAQTKKSTILEFADYQFATGLKDKDFSSNALKKLR